MKSFFYKIINPFRTVYWFVFRPKTTGVKCLIEYDEKFLMIRNSYGHKQWTFLGGGVNRNELLKKAAQREAKEEVDIDIKRCPVRHISQSFFYEPPVSPGGVGFIRTLMEEWHSRTRPNHNSRRDRRKYLYAYIDWYNQVRVHQSLGMTPLEKLELFLHSVNNT